MAALKGVRIVLVRPASPGNVGSVARAMMNFGLGRLVLVDLPAFEDPGYFETEAKKLAWRAAPILDAARRVPTLSEALEGTSLALGASPRALRGSAVVDPKGAASRLLALAERGEAVALVFGGEADGLRNEELSRLAGIVRVPTSEAYPEMNLAQSAVVCCYEIFQAAGVPGAPPAGRAGDGMDAPAPFEEIEALFDLGRSLLAEASYLKPGGDYLADELRRLLGRASPSRREANLLRGILRQIAWATRRGGGAG